MDNLAIARQLDTQRTQIVDRTVVLSLRSPFWTARFGPAVGERLALDYDMNMAALAKAIRYRSPMIFTDHVGWRRAQIVRAGCSTGHLLEVFGYKWSAISTVFPQVALPTIARYLELALETLAYSDPIASAVTAAHDELAEAITAASFDASEEWQAAYRAGGRPAAVRDTWFLIAYAIDALGCQAPHLLGRHLHDRRTAWADAGLADEHLSQMLVWAGEAAAAHLAPEVAAALGNLFQTARRPLDQGSREAASLDALYTERNTIIERVA